MLHGEIGDTIGKNKIKLASLKNHNIDYLALGHYHTYTVGQIDERGTYVYSGCLEGRGFDECGEKGFVVLDVEEKVNHTFIPHSFPLDKAYIDRIITKKKKTPLITILHVRPTQKMKNVK